MMQVALSSLSSSTFGESFRYLAGSKSLPIVISRFLAEPPAIAS